MVVFRWAEHKVFICWLHRRNEYEEAVTVDDLGRRLQTLIRISYYNHFRQLIVWTKTGGETNRVRSTPATTGSVWDGNPSRLVHHPSGYNNESSRPVFRQANSSLTRCTTFRHLIFAQT